MGRSGGLVLLWKKEVKVEILCYSASVIQERICRHEINDLEWAFKEVYGNPEIENQREFWNLLRSLKLRSSISWLIFCNFNELLSHSEKMGGRERLERKLEDFRNVLSDYELKVPGISGQPFTRSK